MADLIVNEDLIRERNKCSFDVNELVIVIDGSEKNNQERKEIEKMVLDVKELWDEMPEEYLSYKERYENAVRKASILYKIFLDQIKSHARLVDFTPTNNYRIHCAVVKEISPMILHIGLFMPTIISQGSHEQAVKWLDFDNGILGTYAQTELGHGTYLRGLETTATYDVDTEEFVLHTPSLTAYKWWPGGLACTVNHCIVMAQLYVNGTCHGIHPFIVPIRDLDTHMPLTGIKVGDIGVKLGCQTANHGFLGFDNYRIPRANMLMKNAKVLKDGTYVRSNNQKLTYGSMVFMRVTILSDMAFELSRAVTIAVRYSAVRRQSQPKPDEPEPQILDYQTQQHKLFIVLASSHAFRICGKWLWDAYTRVTTNLVKGDMEELPELHALSCCLKAVSSRDGTTFVEQCRLACGGHGYMLASNLPTLYGLVTAAVTYEGDYTVLLLQTDRYLIKAWKQVVEFSSLPPNLMYLEEYFKDNLGRWDNSPEGIIRGLQTVAAGKTKAASECLQHHIKSGKHHEDAWNLSSVLLTGASEGHARAIFCEVYWRETQRIVPTVSKNLAEVLLQLAELYLVYWALDTRGDILLYGKIAKEDIDMLQRRYEELLALIRPNAVGLVDSFDLRDELLCSTLGSYDGRVYERMMEQAMKSPLNQEPVNQSFHKYIKPVLRHKL